MSRIIINIQDDTDIEDALSCVQRVVRDGRVSKNNTKYCLGTRFTNLERKINVFVNPNSKSDVFNVWSELKNE